MQSIFKEYDLIKIFNYCKNKDSKSFFPMFYKSTYDLEILYKNSPQVLYEKFLSEHQSVLNGAYDYLYDGPDLNILYKELCQENEMFLKQSLNVQDTHTKTVISFFFTISNELKSFTISYSLWNH